MTTNSLQNKTLSTSMGFFNYLLLCSNHRHKSFLPPLLHWTHWYAVRAGDMGEEVHPSSYHHLGCRFLQHSDNDGIVHSPDPHIQYPLQNTCPSFNRQKSVTCYAICTMHAKTLTVKIIHTSIKSKI